MTHQRYTKKRGRVKLGLFMAYVISEAQGAIRVTLPAFNTDVDGLNCADSFTIIFSNCLIQSAYLPDRGTRGQRLQPVLAQVAAS